MNLTPFVQRFWGFSTDVMLERSAQHVEHTMHEDERRQNAVVDAIARLATLIEKLQGTPHIQISKKVLEDVRAVDKLIHNIKKDIEKEYGPEKMMPDKLQETDPDRTRRLSTLYATIVPAATSYNGYVQDALDHLHSITADSNEEHLLKSLRQAQDHLQCAEDQDDHLIHKEKELTELHREWRDALAQKP